MPSSYVIVEHFEQFIKNQIKQYRYTSASEVIRDGLRVLENREQLRSAKLEALRPDIQQGINSGPGRPVKEVAAELKARSKQWNAQSAAADSL
jgi:antitoxin ParD1/3/4